jgi:hypothetical protein
MKLYSIITQTGYTLLQDVSLDVVEEKIEVQLNNLVKAQNLQVGESLGEYLKLRLPPQISEYMYNNTRKKNYLVTVHRTV